MDNDENVPDEPDKGGLDGFLWSIGDMWPLFLLLDVVIAVVVVVVCSR